MAKRGGQGSHEGRSLRNILTSLHRDTERLRGRRATAATAAKTVSEEIVTFTCSLAGAVVGITCAGRSFAFVGQGSMTLPDGDHVLAYRVAGPANAAFTITASGASMAPINDMTDSKGRAAGTTDITVG